MTSHRVKQDKHGHQREHEDIYIGLLYEGEFSGLIRTNSARMHNLTGPWLIRQSIPITVPLPLKKLDRICTPDTLPDSKLITAMSMGVHLEAQFEHFECTHQLVEYERIALCSRLRLPGVYPRSVVLGLTASQTSQN